MPISNWLANQWLDYFAINGAWLSLHTDDPTALGDPATEVAGGGYLRAYVQFSTPAARGVVSSTGAQFTGVPADEITYFGFWDNQVGGDFLASYLLSPSLVVPTTGVITIAPGDLALLLVDAA